jgi:hypothetical protein
MRRAATLAAAALAAALSLASCVGPDSLVSCTITQGAAKLCHEISQSQSQGLADSCATIDAGAGGSQSYSNGPCSHVGAIGGCSVTNEGVTTTDWFYGDGKTPGMTPADVKKLCGTLGVFVMP